MDRRSGTIIIIDGNSLINRAYYAMQRPMITKEGLYTQGVYGFLNMLAKIKNDYEPQYMAVAFDRQAPTARHLEYEQYKAGRKKMPPELAMQLPLLKEVLAAMNIKILEMDGFEADDIIGTIAVKAEETGLSPLIITGDKDELQLATDKTRVIITRKGISEFDLYDRAAMEEKYGFSPKTFIDYKGLMGDQSDNIPGIPGVGEKTAAKLIAEFGSVENLIENVESIANEKLRNKVKDNAQLAIMSKRLATINTNVPLDINFDEYKVEEPDYDALIALYVRLEFNSFLKKLKKPENAVSSRTFKTTDNVAVIASLEDFDRAARRIRDAEYISIKLLSDNSHIAAPEIHCLGILAGDEFFYINGTEKAVIKHAVEYIAKNRIPICGHNLSSEYFLMFGIAPEITETDGPVFNTRCDTEIAAYVLNPSRSKYDLKALMPEYFNTELPEEEDFYEENAQLDLFGDNSSAYCGLCLSRCTAAAALAPVLEARVKNDGLQAVYEDIELPLIEVMASMEYAGFAVDREALAAAGRLLSENTEKTAEKIYELAGEEFNIKSPTQLGVILFEKLGLPAGKKTKRGYSTNADILEKLRELHPIIDLILEYRSLTKLNSTYVEGLIPLIAGDGRIHAHFMQAVTATGRISCTEPNLQNIPIRQEEGRKLRKAFIPGDEYSLLIGADYSQIELRVLAHMSGDQNLIEAFSHGDDIHRITASKVFGVPLNEVTDMQRSAAKAVNFGVIYGMSSFGLSGEINVSRKEAERYIREYFKRYAGVKLFMDEEVEYCRANGYVKTMMNRRRYVNEINASNYMVRQQGERLAMNSPIQGSAADIIKLAMIKVYEALKREGLKSRLILQVHDELIIETAEGEEERVESLLRDCMENAVEMKVKPLVSLNKGKNWYELK